MDVYVYKYCGNTYINLTNRCNNDCDFCIRHNSDELAGSNLWLKKEPEAEDVIAALKSSGMSDEVVFCGYGEPTLRLDVLKKVAEFIKSTGRKVRINTNGLANAYYERNIAPELKGLADTVSISLNAPNAEKYDSVCHSIYGIKAFNYLLGFTRDCVNEGIDTVLTVVDVIPGSDIEICRQIAQRCGARLRVRTLITDNN